MTSKPLAYCVACKQVVGLCKCEGARGRDVAFALGRPEGDLTPEQKLERWLQLVALQPLARALPAANFVENYKAQGLVQAFERLRPLLAQMAEEYDLKGPDGQPLLSTLQRFGEYDEERLRRDVKEGMAAFAGLDWGTLTNFGLQMVNNALQSSCTLQPEKYPRNSPDLKMAQEVLNVLIAVNDLASGRMEYSLEVNLVLVSDAR